MTPVRGVIFDVDGTLVDSNDAHARAWVQAFHEAGFEVPFARVRAMVGMGGDKIVPIITGFDGKSAEAKALGERRDQIFLERYVQELEPFPDVRALFERLRDDGLGLFIATSSKPEQLKVLLRIANVGDLLSDVASKTDGARSKPDPDIVEAAVSASGLPADRLVMVGDTPYDLEAATRAGVRSIAFRCGGWPDDRLREATQIYDGAWDMLDRIYEFERAFGRSNPS